MIQKKTLLNFTCLFILYFVQAMPFGFQSRYLPLIMRKQGVSITSLGLYKLLLVPWICKFFLAAFIVDVYKTKRFWLLISMIVLAIGSFIGMFLDDFTDLAIIIFILNWASAIQDICVDWFSMSALNKEDLGIGNTIQVGAFKLGTLFSGGFLVYIMDYVNISRAFTILGSVYLLSLFILNLSFFNMESKSVNDPDNNNSDKSDEDKNLSFKEKIITLHKSPATYWLCSFVLIYKLG